MTIREEDFLVQKFGRERHFTVPEGYFAQFHARMMEQVEASQAKVVPLRKASVWHRAIYAAACLLAAVVMTGAYFHVDRLADDAAPVAKASQAVANGDAIDQAADYMMLDESDLYAYMSDF